MRMLNVKSSNSTVKKTCKKDRKKKYGTFVLTEHKCLFHFDPKNRTTHTHEKKIKNPKEYKNKRELEM